MSAEENFLNVTVISSWEEILKNENVNKYRKEKEKMCVC